MTKKFLKIFLNKTNKKYKILIIGIVIFKRNIYNLPNTRQRSSNNCITSRSNSGGFNVSEHENHISTPVSVSNDQNDRWTSPTNQNNRPYVYDLRWEDVNNLELDFPVYTTIPNTRPIPDVMIFLFDLILIIFNLFCFVLFFFFLGYLEFRNSLI